MVKAKKQTHVKALALAVSLATLPLLAQTAYAAGLGRLTVYSAMGQPLRAQLEVTAGKDELSTLSAQLASPDAFRLAGIDYTGALTGLRFSKTVKDDGARKYIEVTTERPLNEPFVDMLVELSWSAGRLVREYTFLLDPPEAAPREAPPPVAITAPVSEAAAPKGAAATPTESVKEPGIQQAAGSSGSKGAGTVAGKAAADQRVAGSGAGAVALGQERPVKSGDTLGKIAREVLSEGISLDQMLVALFRENPDAFDGNMNRMRAGRILRVPDAAAAAAVEPVAARKEVLAHASDFSAYRARVAARAADSAGKEAPVAQASQGKVAPKVEEKAPVAKSGADKLAVSKTESPKDTAGGDKAKARVGALEEDLVARDRALKDANSRIADLEKNLTDLKKLAELKSQTGAAAQKAAEAPKPAAPVKPAEPQKPVEVAKAPEPAKAVEAAKPAEPPKPAATVTPPPAPADAAKPADQASKPAAKPAPKPKKPVVIAEPEPEPDFMEENAPLVFGGGGLIALVLGYLGFAAYRRKKKAAPAAADPAPMTEPSASVASVFSDTVSPSVAPSTVDNLGQTSVLDTVADGGAASIDPLDEADTYLAFGKDSQAEEILLDALKETPTRWAIHLKLLEIYAARRGTVQFNTLAQDLRSQTGASGPEWSRAAEMGRSLDPNNAMYSSQLAEPAKAQADMAATMVFSAPPAMVAAPVQEPEPVQAVSDSDESAAVLDFDLGLDEPAPAPAEQAAEPVADAAEVAALDFDLDLGAEPASEPASDVSKTEPAAAAPPPLNIDFDLELPDTSSAPEPEVAAPLSLSLELPEAAAPASFATETMKLQAPAEIDEETHSASAEVPVEEAPAATKTDDVPDFDFDLGDAPAASEPSDAPVTSVDLPLDAGENPEAATKLELALAYEEMGDRDGARELFQEVLAEGSASQQAAAKARLEQLG